jgi:hypothetical protein
LAAVLLELQGQPPIVAEQAGPIRDRPIRARPIRAHGGSRRVSLPGAAGLTAWQRDVVEGIYQKAYQSTQECPCRKRNISSPQLTPRMAQGARKKGGSVFFNPSELTSCNTRTRPCQTKTVGWGLCGACLRRRAPRFRPARKGPPPKALAIYLCGTWGLQVLRQHRCRDDPCGRPAKGLK